MLMALESSLLDNHITHYPVGGSDEVAKVRYLEQDRRVYINSDQYFEGVPPEGGIICRIYVKEVEK